jgi:hypothetical protein
MFDKTRSIVNISLLVSSALAGACGGTEQLGEAQTALTSDDSFELVAVADGGGGGILDACPNWLSGPGTCQYAGRRMPGPLYYSAEATGQLDDRGMPIYNCVVASFCEMESMLGDDPTFDIAACYPQMWADDCPVLPPRQASFVMSQVVATSLTSATNLCYQDYVVVGTMKLTDEASGACNALEDSAAGTVKCCVREVSDPNPVDEETSTTTTSTTTTTLTPVSTSCAVTSLDAAAVEQLLSEFLALFPEFIARPVQPGDPIEDAAVGELHEASHGYFAALDMTVMLTMMACAEPLVVPLADEAPVERAPAPHIAPSGLIERYKVVKEGITKLNGVIDARRAEAEKALITSFTFALSRLYGVETAAVDKVVQAWVDKLVQIDQKWTTSKLDRSARLFELVRLSKRAREGGTFNGAAILLTGDDKTTELDKLKSYEDSEQKIFTIAIENVMWHIKNDVTLLELITQRLPKFNDYVLNGTPVPPEVLAELGWKSSKPVKIEPWHWAAYLDVVDHDLTRLEAKLAKAIRIVVDGAKE